MSFMENANSASVKSLKASAGAGKFSVEQFVNLLDLEARALLRDSSPNFITSSDSPVDGTKYAVIRFHFDAEALYLKAGAALRAKGLPLPGNYNDLIRHHFGSVTSRDKHGASKESRSA